MMEIAKLRKFDSEAYETEGWEEERVCEKSES
jgi:hypothetical protein